MKEKSKLIQKYPIIIFVVFTFFISHVVNPIIVELTYIIFPSFSFSFPEAGLDERSLISQYGPTIVALFITLRLYGIKGLLSILRFNKIDQSIIIWLLASLLLPLFMILLSYWVAGVSLTHLLNILKDNLMFYLLIVGGFILSAGLAEEFGWRGFLLPQLLKRQAPLTATIVTFIIISLWHFPALIAGWKDEPMLAWIILSFSVTVIHSWFFFKSYGNLWVVILFHACFDAQYSFYSRFISDKDVPNVPFHQGWTYVLLYSFFAFTVILATRGRLSYSSITLDPNIYFKERAP